jgi:MFS family permease
MADRSFGERLARESERWVADGLVTADQAAALRARHPAEPEARRGRAAAALATVGALAIGCGVIAFFAANWDAIPHGARLALLTAAILAAYGGGYHLRERTGSYPRVGEALHLVGVLLFGASLFLVGQMYHVEAHDPLALLVWAAGAFAVAIIVGSHAIAWLALLVFTGWLAFELGLAIEDGENGGLAFPVGAALYGIALYGVGTAARRWESRRWLAETGVASAARQLGLLVAAGGVFAFTFRAVARELGPFRNEVAGATEAIAVALGVVSLAAAALLALDRRRSSRGEAALLVLTVAALGGAIYAGGSGTLWSIVFNVLFAAVALGAIYAGYVSDEPWLVNVGVLLVAIDLVARYFDVFWSALPRSVGLIGAGVLVLVLAWALERQRKRLLERMAA